MSRVRCFLIEQTGMAAQYLRRYVSTARNLSCPLGPYPYAYHNAEVRIEDAPLITKPGEPDIICNGVDPASLAAAKNDTRWPTSCACGYVFTEDDERQLRVDWIYRNTETRETFPLRDAPLGAMWYSRWHDRFFQPQLEHCISIKLPGGTEWCVDSQANNCTMKEDHGQRQHHCWIVRGTPPNLTVTKDGPTCAAGAGSIAAPGYHGFLRDGWLEDA